jgi:EAL domain-containing protein (putative c-di-GMP-specific phosphodiesterase class I)
MRCHEAQGWFFGKPIPAADLPFQVNQRSTLGATKRYVGGLR